MGQFSVRYPAAKDLLQRRQRVWAAFKAIGDEFGPVDLAIMENGQYDQDWKYIHMMPDETAQAADDLRARAVLLGMQDDSFWRNTAGMNRINGWRLPAKEGLASADATVQASRCGSPIRRNHLTPGGAKRQCEYQRKAYDDFRSGD